jgi:glycine/D-amino acid oxidase-like deaminating enzyme
VSLVNPTPIWSTDDSVSSIPLPSRADVIIIGAGLAGTAVALFLAEAGVEPLVIDSAAQVGRGISGRGSGVVLPLLADMPAQLISALGETGAKDLINLAQRGIAELDALGVLQRCGVLHAASLPQERRDHSANLAALQQLDVVVEEWSAAQVEEGSRTQGFGRGLWLPNAGFIQPGLAVSAIAAKAQAAGARFALNTRAIQLRPHGVESQVQTSQGQIRCDVVIIANNVGAPTLEPWFSDKIHPVRTQLAAWRPGESPIPFPIQTQLGYATLRPHSDGGLIAGGCRWATPHLEVGEDDERVCSPAVHQKLVGMAQRHAPTQANGEPSHAWAGIMGFSCDGLPLIGPIPGRSRWICCLGFGGHQSSLGVAAARLVSDGLLGGDASPGGSLWSPRRFV